MRTLYAALVAAAGLLLTIGASAEAAGRGGGSAAFTPPGFSSPGNHKGFEQIPERPERDGERRNDNADDCVTRRPG